MRILLLLSSWCMVIFLSCGDNASSERKHDSVADSVIKNDTVAQMDTVPAAIIASQLGGDTITPQDKSQIFYSFTKKMVENKNKVLSAKEVTKRFLPVDPECDEESMWTLRRFFELDSLKKIGEQPDSYMGQTILVEIREYDTIRVDDNSIWVAWTMFYETEQACPYATGTYFMLSTYDKYGHLISTQCMGRDCGGADAPLQWVSKQESNIFNDGSFRGLLADTSGEDDFDKDPDIAIMRKTFTGVIASGGKITTEVKEIERND